MALTLFLLASLMCTIGVVQATGASAWDNVPECQQVHDSGYSVPNCEAASACFKQAHEKAHKCIAEELKDKNVRTCQRKPEIQAIRKRWFKASCRWHLAVTKCMSGDSTEGWQSTDGNEQQAENDLRFLFKRSPDHHQNHGHAHGEGGHGATHSYGIKAGTCWREVHQKLDECKQSGAACDHFKVCTGEEEDTESPDDNQAQWYTISHRLKQQKTAQTQEYRTKIKDCVQQEAADESTEAEPTAAAHHHHGDGHSDHQRRAQRRRNADDDARDESSAVREEQEIQDALAQRARDREQQEQKRQQRRRQTTTASDEAQEEREGTSDVQE